MIEPKPLVKEEPLEHPVFLSIPSFRGLLGKATCTPPNPHKTPQKNKTTPTNKKAQKPQKPPPPPPPTPPPPVGSVRNTLFHFRLLAPLSPPPLKLSIKLGCPERSGSHPGTRYPLPSLFLRKTPPDSPCPVIFFPGDGFSLVIPQETSFLIGSS